MRRKWENTFKILILIFTCIIISKQGIAQNFSITYINKNLDFGSFVITGSGQQSITLDTLNQNLRQKSTGILFLSSAPSFSFMKFRISRDGSGGNNPVTVRITYSGSFSVSGLSVSYTPAPTNITLRRNETSRIITVGGVLTISPPVSPAYYSTSIIINTI